MNSLALHDHTKEQLDRFAAKPSHAILLHGPKGSGKAALARLLAARLLGISAQDLQSFPYKVVVSSLEGKAISIESIRTLEHFLSLKVPTSAAYNRFVIIEDSDLLTHEAQNALLKTLEEPPEATFIILTSSTKEALLPTITSRLQEIIVTKPPAQKLIDHFTAAGFSETDIQQVYAISGGLPGLMQALLSDSDHPLKPATLTARLLLQQTAYERMLQVDELSKHRQLAIDVLYILQQMAHARLQVTTGSQFTKWLKILSASYTARNELQNSAQPKLVLDALMLKLS